VKDVQTYKINDFEGPLDLLLHLIKDNKMDLLDFDIKIIIDQYLNYIDQAKEIDLEIASDFLTMASTLVELKSKMLLPLGEFEIVSDYEEVDEQELVNRLIEYKKYKDVSSVLKEYNQVRSLSFSKPIEDLKQYSIEDDIKLPQNIELYDLVKSFDKLMQRIALQKPKMGIFKHNEISLQDRMQHLMNQLTNINKKRVGFEELLDVHTKHYLIVSFFFFFVLAKKNIIIIEQDVQFDNIFILGVDC
jgi:segregation and condensation protein A